MLFPLPVDRTYDFGFAATFTRIRISSSDMKMTGYAMRGKGRIDDVATLFSLSMGLERDILESLFSFCF